MSPICSFLASGFPGLAFDMGAPGTNHVLPSHGLVWHSEPMLFYVALEGGKMLNPFMPLSWAMHLTVADNVSERATR